MSSFSIGSLLPYCLLLSKWLFHVVLDSILFMTRKGIIRWKRWWLPVMFNKWVGRRYFYTSSPHFPFSFCSFFFLCVEGISPISDLTPNRPFLLVLASSSIHPLTSEAKELERVVLLLFPLCWAGSLFRFNTLSRFSLLTAHRLLRVCCVTSELGVEKKKKKEENVNWDSLLGRPPLLCRTFLARWLDHTWNLHFSLEKVPCWEEVLESEDYSKNFLYFSS